MRVAPDALSEGVLIQVRVVRVGNGHDLLPLADGPAFTGRGFSGPSHEVAPFGYLHVEVAGPGLAPRRFLFAREIRPSIMLLADCGCPESVGVAGDLTCTWAIVVRLLKLLGNFARGPGDPHPRAG